jgi:hypothetical protein
MHPPCTYPVPIRWPSILSSWTRAR